MILQTSELAVNVLLCLLFFLHIRFLEWKFYEKLNLVYLFLKTLIPISVCVHVGVDSIYSKHDLEVTSV